MSDSTTRQYARVLAVWTATLAALYAFQYWFTR